MLLLACELTLLRLFFSYWAVRRARLRSILSPSESTLTGLESIRAARLRTDKPDRPLADRLGPPTEPRTEPPLLEVCAGPPGVTIKLL